MEVRRVRLHYFCALLISHTIQASWKLQVALQLTFERTLQISFDLIRYRICSSFKKVGTNSSLPLADSSFENWQVFVSESSTLHQLAPRTSSFCFLLMSFLSLPSSASHSFSAIHSLSSSIIPRSSEGHSYSFLHSLLKSSQFMHDSSGHSDFFFHFSCYISMFSMNWLSWSGKTYKYRDLQNCL